MPIYILQLIVGAAIGCCLGRDYLKQIIDELKSCKNK